MIGWLIVGKVIIMGKVKAVRYASGRVGRGTASTAVFANWISGVQDELITGEIIAHWFVTELFSGLRVQGSQHHLVKLMGYKTMIRLTAQMFSSRKYRRKWWSISTSHSYHLQTHEGISDSQRSFVKLYLLSIRSILKYIRIIHSIYNSSKVYSWTKFNNLKLYCNKRCILIGCKISQFSSPCNQYLI